MIDPIRTRELVARIGLRSGGARHDVVESDGAHVTIHTDNLGFERLMRGNAPEHHFQDQADASMRRWRTAAAVSIDKIVAEGKLSPADARDLKRRIDNL